VPESDRPRPYDLVVSPKAKPNLGRSLEDIFADVHALVADAERTA
jgi:hypothetical protein